MEIPWFKVNNHSITPLIYRGLRFLKNHRRGWGSRFLVKMGGLSIEGGGKCFLLMMYGFCSKNNIYSASLSFAIFFLISPFDSVYFCVYPKFLWGNIVKKLLPK